MKRELLAVLDEVKIEFASATPADLRWGVIFYDSEDKAQHSIHLDGWYFFRGAGRKGLVDGVPVSFDSLLVGWLEDLARLRRRGEE